MDGLDDFLKNLGGALGDKTLKPLPKPSAPRNPYRSLVEESAARHDVDPDLIEAMMGQESNFKPNAKSNKDAHGLMQLIPATASRFDVTDIYDPKQNIEGGTKYVKFLLGRFNGDVDKVLAGYNAGEGAVDKYNGIPPYAETRDYVKKIRSNYKGNGYYKSQAAPENLNDFLGSLDSALGAQPESAKANLGGFLGELDKIGTPPALASGGELYPKPEEIYTDKRTGIATPKPITAPTPTFPQNVAPLEIEQPKTDLNGFLGELDKIVAPTNPALLAVEPNVSAPVPTGQLTPDYMVQAVTEGNIPRPDAIGAVVPPSQTPAQKQQKPQISAPIRQNAVAPPFGQSAEPTPEQLFATSQIAPMDDVSQYQRQGKQPTEKPSVEATKIGGVLKGSAGNLQIDLARKPKGVSAGDYLDREALRQVAPKFGITDAEIDKFIASHPDTTSFKDLTDEAIGKNAAQNKGVWNVTVPVANSAINEILQARIGGNPNEINPALQSEIGLQENTLSGGLAKNQNNISEIRKNESEFEQVRARLIAEVSADPFSGGKMPTDEAVNERFQRDKSNREQAEVDAEYWRSNVGSLGSKVIGDYLGSAGRVFTGLAGIARPFQGLSDAPFKLFSDIAAANESVHQAVNKGDDSFGSKVLDTLISSPTDLARIGLLTRLPGSGAVVGFAADAALQSAGRGENAFQIGGETVKGAALGASFGVAGKAGELAGKIAPILNPVARIGTVGGSTYAIERIAGTPHDEALQDTILNVLFEVVQTYGEKGLNKVYRSWKDGKATDIKVEENGDAVLLDGSNKPEDIDAEIVLDPKNKEYENLKKAENKEKIESENSSAPSEDSLIGQTVETQIKGKTKRGKIADEKNNQFIVEFEGGGKAFVAKNKARIAEKKSANLTNETAPVVEAPATFEAQSESAKKSDSPRIATLYTKGAEVPPLSAADGKILYDVSIAETGETLRLNQEKAREFFKSETLPTDGTVNNFIKENGYADLIAKAENVGTDTATGAAVVARDERGVELSASKVTSEESAAKQIEINKKEFGENVSQSAESVGEVVQKREAETNTKSEIQPDTKQSDSNESPDHVELKEITKSGKDLKYAEHQLGGEKSNEREIFLTAPKTKESWKDGHADYDDVSNPVVRLRVSDRVDTANDKVLHIDEMQPSKRENLKQMPSELQNHVYQLGVEHALRMAAAGDYSKITWTTGKQQLDRSNLQNHYDSVQYRRAGFDGDKISVRAFSKDGDTTADQILSKDELENFFGKATAQKMLESVTPQPKILDRADLQTGKGLPVLYDNVIPNLFNRFGKKLNVRSDKTEIDTGGQKETVHSLEITPELKQSILAESGQPIRAKKPNRRNEAGAIDLDLLTLGFGEKIKNIADKLFPPKQKIVEDVNAESKEIVMESAKTENRGESKTGKSVEAKAIEKGLTEAFSNTAEYDKITIKDQAEKAAKLANENPETLKQIINSEKSLPDGLRGASVIKAAEDLAIATGDAQLLKDIAGSRLTSETSVHAQEMRLLRERSPDSPVTHLHEIATVREKQASKRLPKGETVESAKNKIIDEIKHQAKQVSRKKIGWNEFIDSIQCNY